MRRIYHIFIFMVIGIIGLTILLYVLLSNIQTRRYYMLVSNQEQKCANNLLKLANGLESNMTKLLTSEDISTLFNTTPDPSCIKAFELFYENYPTFITGISVYDTSKHVFNLLYKEKTDRYISDLYTTHFQKNLCTKDSLEYENDQYQLPFR